MDSGAAEILAVVFLFHWRTLNLLSEAIRLETFIECSLDFGCIGIEERGQVQGNEEPFLRFDVYGRQYRGENA